MPRLPIPGSDKGDWGSILNDYLSQTHGTNGTLKNAVVGTSQLEDKAVNETKLSDAVVAKLNANTSTALGDLSNVTTDGASNGQVLKYNGTQWTPAVDDVSGGGGGANLSTSQTATTVTIANDGGTDAFISAATTDNAGVLTASDKIKLDSIASGATANGTDASLLNRSNHTGSQAISTITNLQTTLDGKQASGSYATNTALTNGLATKADTNTVVTLTGAQTVAGVKTFSNAPVVPDGSFTIAKTTNLQTTLSGKITGQNGALGLWIGSQAQYDAIPSPSATTLYVINNA